MRKILFVLGGLDMGGVETYVIRLAEELQKKGNKIDILLLSKKIDNNNLEKISHFANVYIINKFWFLSSTSWFNSFFLYDKLKGNRYDIVHVVDIAMLGFVFFNRKNINFDYLSVGIYHSMETVWWRDKNTYFRNKLLELFDRNISLTLFPNEETLNIAKEYSKLDHVNDFNILPLGINLAEYKDCTPNKHSLRIISIGRLVDFKTYNENIISCLKKLRELAAFEYYVYGEGPQKNKLKKMALEYGVSDYVHFMGEIKYCQLKDVLNKSFCFIGSGTTIIEASAAGIPSIVGIESIEQPLTCGFFSEIEGYSYNESSATSRRVSIESEICQLYKKEDGEYELLSLAHREKAKEFDICVTSEEFLLMSNKKPDFDFTVSRIFCLFSFLFSIVKFGPADFKSRFNRR